MSEQLHLTPEQATDRSGELYKDHKDIADGFASYDRTASYNAAKIEENEEGIANTDNSELIEAKKRKIAHDQRDLEISAGMAYTLKMKLEQNQDEAASLLKNDGGALHEAALASAKLHGIEIVEPKND